MSGAAHLPARLARVAELSEQLSEARAEASAAVREALEAGETYRSLASRFGLSLGAVQRLAGKTDQPSRRAPLPGRGSGGTYVQPARVEGEHVYVSEVPEWGNPQTPAIMAEWLERHGFTEREAAAAHLPAAVCARSGCGAPALPGKRCCRPHHENW